MPTLTRHKVAKNEKLNLVIKKYGHKDWRLIWKDKANAQISKKRGAPEKLQPGDIVMIPPTAKQAKEEAAYVARLEASLKAETAAYLRFQAFAKLFRKNADFVKKDMAQIKASYDKMIAETLAVAAKAKRTGDAADITADVAMMFIAVGKLAQGARKATTATTNQLKKINQEAIEGAVEFMSAPVVKVTGDVANKAYRDAKSEKSMIGMIASETLDGLGKLTKPSFWGQTVAHLIDGKDWSTAVTADAVKDLKAVATSLARDRDAALKSRAVQETSLRKRAAEMDKAAKASAKFAANLEKELADRM